MMHNRQVGTLSNAAPRTVGKFYQTQKLSDFQDVPSKDAFHYGNPPTESIKTRTKSVGHIYTTRRSVSKQPAAKAPPASPGYVATKIDYDRLINYNEVENKLSSYLECTIRTNSRQKYNYLSTHYNQRYGSITTNLRGEQNYGSDRRQHLLRVIDNHREDEPVGLKQRKNNLINEQYEQINVQKAQKIEKIEKPKVIEKPIRIDKNERKSLKNSRKTQSKQKITNYQASATKNQNKQNIFPIPPSTKKELNLGMLALNHEQHKNQLENKLKKLISNYEVKNKQLQTQMKKISAQSSPPQAQKRQQKTVVTVQAQKEDTPVYKDQELKQIQSKLIEFNLKGINLAKECDEKQQQIWKSIHRQILADEQLRIVKCFINQANINLVFTILNENRIKKVEISQLKTHPDQYDPFLIQKIHELLKCNNPNLNHKQTCKWISEQFAKAFELSQKNWLKHLSQQKMQCIIRTMVLEKEVTSLRKSEGSSKQLLIRDFTRYLSTLFKANLRNRNVYQIHHKLKSMSYLGRFIELLEEKAGKGVDVRKGSLPK